YSRLSPRSHCPNLRIRCAHRIPRGHSRQGSRDGCERWDRSQLPALQWTESLRPFDGYEPYRLSRNRIQPDGECPEAHSAIPYCLSSMNRWYRRLSNIPETEKHKAAFVSRDREECSCQYRVRSSNPPHRGEAFQGMSLSEKHKYPCWPVLFPE